MEKKEFKAESKRLLDLMIHSIYTNKEIFLRELISNASDAIDKLYYRSLTDKEVKVEKDQLKIDIEIDRDARTLTISDNGCGMTKEELENNLGTIAKSGSFAFKNENDKNDEIDIIGQFGVGFYSAFMVSDHVTVCSRAYGAEDAYQWSSEGADGYTIEKAEKEGVGTTITLKIKEDTEEEKYSEYLEEYTIKMIVKKYSDYIRYPIILEEEHQHLKEGTKDQYEMVKEKNTINSMVPIWKKKKSEVKEEEYEFFYQDKFMDYHKPAKIIHTNIEGQYSYTALLYIPSEVPFDFYHQEYEKGLQLYSNGVLIMEKCSDLLPDYFGFVKGLVDSQDLSLNISREMLQNDRGLRVISKSIEKKIHSELQDMLKNDRETYETFFKAFGTGLKFGVYNEFGRNKDKLKDLLLFYSSTEKKMVTIEEYIARMKEEQTDIYYVCGESIDKIDLLPQVETFKEKEYEVLYLTENVDEFVFQVLTEYNGKKFKNISSENIDLDTQEEKEKLKKENESNKDMFTVMKEAIGEEVQVIRLTHRLKNHPVCLTTEGEISIEMEKVLNSMPNNQKVQAKIVLEINEKHPIVAKLKNLYQTNQEQLKVYSKILYAQARLIEGLTIDNPTEISNLVCEILSEEEKNS